MSTESSPQPLTILLAGTPGTTVLVGEALLGGGHQISAVLSPFPKPVGRKKVITPSELETWARGKNIPVLNVNKEVLGQEAFRKALPQVDLLVVADFGYLVPPWLLNLPKYGALNIHPSLLPRWRGASPVPFTILFGDTTTGVTIIKMNEEFDKGEIVAQENVEMKLDDTTPTLLDRAFQKGAELLVETLPNYVAGTMKVQPQPSSSTTPLTQRFTKEDGFVPYATLLAAIKGETVSEAAPLLEKYHLPTNAASIERMIRAISPWPGVWTVTPQQKRVKILAATLTPTQTLIVKQSQLEGKNPQDGLVA